MPDFYKKTSFKHQQEVVRYSDRKSIFICYDAFSKRSLLFRTNPTCKKQRDKFLYSCGISLSNNDLSILSTKPQDDNVVFIIVTQSDKGKRLVLKTDPQYGSLTLVQQKKVEVIPDTEPEFDPDAELVEFEEEQEKDHGCYEDEQYNSLSFRKNDDLCTIVKYLCNYIKKLLSANVIATIMEEEGNEEKKSRKRSRKSKASNLKPKCVKRIPEIEEESEGTLMLPTSSSPEIKSTVMPTPLNSPYMPMVSQDEQYDENKFDKAYVLHHLNFFAHLFQLKNQYQIYVDQGQNIEYMDILNENWEHFELIDPNVSFKLINKNVDLLNDLMDCISISIERGLIDSHQM